MKHEKSPNLRIYLPMFVWESLSKIPSPPTRHILPEALRNEQSRKNIPPPPPPAEKAISALWPTLQTTRPTSNGCSDRRPGILCD